MVYTICSPKYQPMITKILTETDEVCGNKEVGEDIYLKKMIKENISTFDGVEILIVDMTALADTDQEVLQAFESLRIIDYEIRIILIAPYKKEGDKFLRECFYAGIYDLITTDEYLELSEQLRKCIVDGMKYKDALRYRDAAEQEDSSENNPALQKIIVGVVGAAPRMGSTHMSIVIANYLRSRQQMTAILEMNGSGNFEEICNSKSAKVFDDGYFTLSGVDFYPGCDRERLTAISGKLYNFIVLDFGAYGNCDKVLFNKSDIRIIFCGVKSWELPVLEQVFRDQDEDVLQKYHFGFLCTTSGKLQKEIIESMEPLENVWFPEYSENPFAAEFPEGSGIFAAYLPAPMQGTGGTAKGIRKFFDRKNK